MRLKLLVVMVLVLAIAVLGGCGGKQSEKLVVGLDDNFPPMGFRDENNKIVGFDVEMATEAAKRMGMAVEFKPIDWNSKEAELGSKRVDLLWNGLTITDKRKENILFTKPYMENRQVIIVLKDSPLKTKADLAGKVVGAQDGSSSLDAIARDAVSAAAFKELRKYPDNVAALMDLQTGRLDAVVVDEIVGRYYIAKRPGEYVVLADHFGAEEYGVGLRKDDQELLTKLQAALTAMNEDGTAAEISKKWFGENIVK